MKRTMPVLVVAVLGLLSPRTANAGSLMLGDSGWEAIWPDAFDAFIGVVVNPDPDPLNPSPDTVFIERSLEFASPGGKGGIPSLPMIFRQTEATDVDKIAISQEIVINSTDTAWNQYAIRLVDRGGIAFSPALTNASGGGAGFDTSPLVNQTFGMGNGSFTADGFGAGPGGSDAVLPSGGIGFFGVGPGDLFIVATPADQAPFPSFSVSTIPIPIPEPSTMALLIIGGSLIAARRRRRR